MIAHTEDGDDEQPMCPGCGDPATIEHHHAKRKVRIACHRCDVAVPLTDCTMHSAPVAVAIGRWVRMWDVLRAETKEHDRVV